MNKKAVLGGLALAVTVVAVTIALVYVFHIDNDDDGHDDDHDDHEDDNNVVVPPGPKRNVLKPIAIEVGRENDCCLNISLTGIGNADEFNKILGGDYVPYTALPFIRYETFQPDTLFPVFVHTLDEDRGEFGPRKSFLYFYYNEDPRIKEKQCPDGCWMIGMHDPTPRNYWFDKRYFFMADQSACPNDLTAGSKRFANNVGSVENALRLTCTKKPKL